MKYYGWILLVIFLISYHFISVRKMNDKFNLERDSFKQEREQWVRVREESANTLDAESQLFEVNMLAWELGLKNRSELLVYLRAVRDKRWNDQRNNHNGSFSSEGR